MSTHLLTFLPDFHQSLQACSPQHLLVSFEVLHFFFSEALFPGFVFLSPGFVLQFFYSTILKEII